MVAWRWCGRDGWQGNAAFKSGQYERAAAAYTEGLTACLTERGGVGLGGGLSGDDTQVRFVPP